MGRPTAGYDLLYDGSPIGIVQEFEENIEGDTEDISGVNDTQGDIVRRKGAPVDVGGTITVSGKVDESKAGYGDFKEAMEERKADESLQFSKNGDGYVYTGHAENYSESASRTDAVWNFSLTFYVNSRADATP